VRYPQNVAAIMIRNLTVGETVLASGRVWGDKRAQQMTQSPLWMEANDGDTLSRKLRQRGLL
jgi:ABC superfamily ATP binding cassette transporter